MVTAVSGGSNMAAGWSLARSVYQTDLFGNADRMPPADITPRPWSTLQDEMTLEERHLFANLGYLLASSPRATAGSDSPASRAEEDSDTSNAGKAEKYRPTAVATVLAGFAINVAVFVGVL